MKCGQIKALNCDGIISGLRNQLFRNIEADDDLMALLLFDFRVLRRY